MLGTKKETLGILVGIGVCLAQAPTVTHADDSGFLGRLFRIGGSSSSSNAKPASRSTEGSGRPSPLPYGGGAAGGSYAPPATSSPLAPGLTPSAGPITEGPSTPEVSQSPESQPHVAPRSRVSHAVTQADPLLTRMALGRSNDGATFGMFLQIFADGTVVDSEGVHRLSPSDIRPIAEAIQSGELARVRGHCNTPSGDFVEYVHILVFERKKGRLQANSFSYSGSPQGCDASIRHLHGILETIQAKLSRQPGPATTAGTTAHPAPTASLTRVHSTGAADANPVLTAPAATSSLPALPDPGTPANGSAVIPLTPVSPR